MGLETMRIPLMLSAFLSLITRSATGGEQLRIATSPDRDETVRLGLRDLTNEDKARRAMICWRVCARVEMAKPPPNRHQVYLGPLNLVAVGALTLDESDGCVWWALQDSNL
jgi:hypothetical protein